MKKIIFYILLLTSSYCFGQDIHFSQFQYSPLNLSPSQTGYFNGDYRLAFNQKTQWRSVTKPFVTFSFSADAKNLITDKLSTGILVFNDRTGDSDFNTFQANLTNSFYIPFKQNSDASKGLSFGILTGFTQKQLNITDLQFDNQYNGLTFDPSLSNNENFDTNKKQYLNFHLGVSYVQQINIRNKFTFGISANNLTKPDEQFLNNNDNVKLSQRLNFYGNAELLISDKVDALPAFIISRQGTFTEIIFGTEGKYRFKESNNTYLAARAGIFYRNQDATFVSAGLDYNNLQLGISYDFNLSSLKTASLGKGGFEFSVIYILKKFTPKMSGKFACPSFI